MFKTLKYTDKEKTCIQVENEDGTIMSVPIAPGNRHYEEILQSNLEIEDYVEPEKSINQLRQEAYNESGCTVEALIIAKWEADVEGRTEALDELQAKREAIKSQYPKTT